jgi:hypothetical protein
MNTISIEFIHIHLPNIGLVSMCLFPWSQQPNDFHESSYELHTTEGCCYFPNIKIPKWQMCKIPEVGMAIASLKYISEILNRDLCQDKLHICKYNNLKN